MEKKKEIWIEKLIRYLLESKWEEYKEEYYEWYRDVELEQNIDSLSELKPFIKWLVENDKIDRERINDRWWDMSIHFTDEELFIMSLSISNTPIEDLISYLK